MRVTFITGIALPMSVTGPLTSTRRPTYSLNRYWRVLRAVDIIGILFVIQYIRRTVLRQERHLFPPYYPTCRCLLLCYVLLPP